MKVLFTSIAVMAILFIVSCNKSSGPSAGGGPNSLFPLKQGSVWYYVDSAFQDSVFLGPPQADTMTPTKNTTTDNQGITYLQLNDNPDGWFSNSYIGVDPNNTAIYEADSPSYSPYLFFAVAGQDGATIGTGTSQGNNLSCPFYTTQYGYVTPVTVGQWSNCLTNVEYTTDCNGVPEEEIISYVSPGTGVVRIEDWVPDSTAGGPLHKYYTQTLQSATIGK